MALKKTTDTEEKVTPVGGTEEPHVDPEEMAAAEAEAVNASGTVHIDLKRPIDYAGEHYEKFDFDFEDITGRECLQIEREVEAVTGKTVVVDALNSEYLIRFAAHASQTPVGADVFYALKARDFIAVKGAARSFLLNSGS